MSLYERVEAISITFMHKHLYRLFANPNTMLTSAGLKEGDKILEVGFGPGFFTFPASEIVGEKGLIHAIEINSIFVKKLQKKIDKLNKRNIVVKLENVTKTSLDNDTMDVAFFFGVFHNLTSVVDEVVSEMYRILKPGGLMTIQKSHKPLEKYLEKITAEGRFELLEEKKRMIIFRKKDINI